jgi:hypothetical protein
MIIFYLNKMTIDKIIKPFIDENIYIYHILPFLTNQYLNKNEKEYYINKLIFKKKKSIYIDEYAKLFRIKDKKFKNIFKLK